MTIPLREYSASRDLGHARADARLQLGILSPPDWVGEFVFTDGEDPESVFETGMVTNYESKGPPSHDRYSSRRRGRRADAVWPAARDGGRRMSAPVKSPRRRRRR